MSLFRRKRTEEDGAVSVEHYAPDVTLAAVDYALPTSLPQRMERSETRIKAFLKNAEPDALCESFFDHSAEAEEQLILAYLKTQTPAHSDANRSISVKHRGELARLLVSIDQVNEFLAVIDDEIHGLQDFYCKNNG